MEPLGGVEPEVLLPVGGPRVVQAEGFVGQVVPFLGTGPACLGSVLFVL